MQLPCRHILAVRSISELDLYCAELCACRWTLAYYHSNHRVLAAESTSDFDNSLTIIEHAVRTKPILSQHDKYRKAFRITQKLTSIVSEAPMREFEEKLESLKRIVHMWETGSQVILQDAAEFPDVDHTSAAGESIAQTLKSTDKAKTSLAGMHI